MAVPSLSDSQVRLLHIVALAAVHARRQRHIFGGWVNGSRVVACWQSHYRGNPRFPWKSFTWLIRAGLIEGTLDRMRPTRDGLELLVEEVPIRCPITPRSSAALPTTPAPRAPRPVHTFHARQPPSTVSASLTPNTIASSIS